jgi:hypothetical protein
MEKQLPRMPSCTHVVLAVGGNDLMRLAGGRGTWISRAGSVLARLEGVLRELRQLLVAIQVPLCVCTLHRLAVGNWATRAAADFIIREYNRRLRALCSELSIPILDLYSIFDPAVDLCNGVEPSPIGAAKIVTNTLAFLDDKPGTRAGFADMCCGGPRLRVYAHTGDPADVLDVVVIEPAEVESEAEEQI